MNKFVIILSIFFLSSCTETVDRLKRVGKSPQLAQVDLPTHEDHEDVANTARLERHRSHMRKTNSLWQPGNTTFFTDSRAWQPGDIVKVVVKIQDSAKLDNSTKQSRSGKDSMGLTNFFGKEAAMAATISKRTKEVGLDPAIGANSSRNHTGGGNISRQESIATEIAALVIKVLPNGNLVIEGHQEVKVNYELREIKIAGIIRPKDINADNSINLNQIAEARISYSGRGVVSDVQQPRVGSQVIDIISPF